jgi:dolichyl-phosphate-mannose--protein O-mannosyl transferase
VLIYFLSYGLLFYHHDLNHFLELHNQIWLYQVNLDATHPFSSTALQWPFGYQPIYYYLDPITHQQIWARPTVPIFLMGIVGIIYSIIKILTNLKNLKKTGIYSLILLNIFYFGVWAPWIFSPRIMFIYHYLPAIPILCILIGYLANDMQKSLPKLKLLLKET